MGSNGRWLKWFGCGKGMGVQVCGKGSWVQGVEFGVCCVVGRLV